MVRREGLKVENIWRFVYILKACLENVKVCAPSQGRSKAIVKFIVRFNLDETYILNPMKMSMEFGPAHFHKIESGFGLVLYWYTRYTHNMYIGMYKGMS